MSIKFYFDIETIPDQRDDAFDRYLDAVKPPANYKKQETIDKWLAENAEAAALESFLKTGLNGLYGEICSVSWALDDGEIHNVTLDLNENDDEGALLEMFWFILDKQAKEVTPGGQFPRLQWVGHNVIDFDLRFLKQRSIVNGIKPAFLVPADARHGGDMVFDTMKEWAGFRGYVKQDELVEVLGIEPPPWIDEDILDVDGSKVWDIYRAGDFKLISDYNRLDVYYVREIHKRMTYR